MFKDEETTLKHALMTTIVNKFDDSREIETVKARIESIFGVKM
jgi:hypothetical protein